MKEFFRKMMVSLKRRPQNIPFFASIVAFVYYSFNLTQISNTTAKIQGANMGLCGFVTMLLSMLIFVCFINAFPKRKKPNVFMLIVMYIMFALIIVSDLNYRYRITVAMKKPDFAGVMAANPYIAKALTIVTVHVILVVIVAVLVALLPVYGKLMQKIKTNIDVEDNGTLETIEVDED
ncbi:MAG: hypothetical protein ACI4EX_14335 [Lachnospiraceae bacterium]